MARSQYDIDVTKVENFVMCDIQNLPFRDDAFEIGYSYHVIEHGDEPWVMFKEMVRVSKEKVSIKCPNGIADRLNRLHKSGTHKQFLSKKWFSEACRRFPWSFTVGYSGYGNPFPLRGLRVFRFPSEINVIVNKTIPASTRAG